MTSRVGAGLQAVRPVRPEHQPLWPERVHGQLHGVAQVIDRPGQWVGLGHEARERGADVGLLGQLEQGPTPGREVAAGDGRAGEVLEDEAHVGHGRGRSPIAAGSSRVRTPRSKVSPASATADSPRRTSARDSQPGSASSPTGCRRPTSNSPPGPARSVSMAALTSSAVRSTQPTTPHTQGTVAASASSSRVRCRDGSATASTVPVTRSARSSGQRSSGPCASLGAGPPK